MRVVTVVWATAAVWFACAGADRHAQEIAVTRVSTLGASGPEPLNARLARLVDGGVYVVPAETDGEIMVFDLGSGEMLAEERLGGSGPGEIRLANALAPGEDGSVIVADVGNRKLLTLNADLQPLGSVRLPDGLSVEQQGLRRLPDGSYFINGTSRAATGDVLLIHRFDVAGGTTSSWEPLDRSTRLVAPTFRALAVDHGGRLWSSFGSHLALTHWDRSGSEITSLELSPDWFSQPSVSPGRPVQEQPGHSVAPPTFVIGIEADAEGLLWALVRVPDPDWSPSDEEAPSDQMFDSVIAVIDPAVGVVVASRHLPVFVRHLLGEGHALVQRSDENGIPFADIVRLSLTR